MDADMTNLAAFIVTALKDMMIKDVQLYRSGNMQRSTVVAEVNDEYVDIIIAVPYASYTNTRGKMAGWIERTIDRACRCFSEKNSVENTMFEGSIIYGG